MNVSLFTFFKSGWNCALMLAAIAALVAGITGAARKAIVEPAMPPFATTTTRGLVVTKISNKRPAESADLAAPTDPEVAATPEDSETTSSSAPASSGTATSLSQEKSASIALLASGTGTEKAVADARSTTIGSPKISIPASVPGVWLPLAFQPVNPQALTPAIQTKLAQLQDEFLQSSGGNENARSGQTSQPESLAPTSHNQDDGGGQTPQPTSDQPLSTPVTPTATDGTPPSRLVSAQEEADMKYRALFGWMAFEEMQLQRAQSAGSQAQ